MIADTVMVVRTCDKFRKMGPFLKYMTNSIRPVEGLFDVYSIDVSGTFPTTKEGISFLVVNVEHLTGCPLYVLTNTATIEVVIRLVEGEILPPFGPQRLIVSDSVNCFTAKAVDNFIKKQ